MDQLVAALRAALDEDERLARYSGGTGVWSVGDCIDADHGTTQWEISEGPYVHSLVRGNTRANHVAHHDPARVLRKVAAMRKVLDTYARAVELANRPTMRSATSTYASGCHDGLWTAILAFAEEYGIQASSGVR